MAIAWALIGCLSIAYGVALMRLRSGTFFYTVWCALGCVCLMAAWIVHSGMWDAAPTALKLIVIAIIAATTIVLAFVDTLIFSQFKASGEPDLEYLIVLGAQIYAGGRPSPVLRYRLDAALEYLQGNHKTKCVVSGGQGPDEPFAEAEGMAAYLLRRGIARERIMLEDKSANTVQNISYSFKLIGSLESRVGIVTNNFHVFRAVRLAQKAGAQHVCGIAAYSTLWNLPNNLLRESFAVIKDYLVGNL